MSKSGILNPTRIPKSRMERRVAHDAVAVMCSMLAVKGSIIANRSMIQRRYKRTMDIREQVVILFQKLAKPMRVDVVAPDMGSLPANLDAHAALDWIEKDNKRFAEALVKQLRGRRIGRWSWLGDKALSYSFYDVERKGGVWTNTFTHSRTQHELLNPRFNAIPVKDLKLPKIAQNMQNEIMNVDPKIRDHFCIITGTLTAKGTIQTEQYQEDTALKKTMKSATTAIVGGLAATGAAVGAMAATLAVDPALCFADVVLYGWE